jgi:predicted MFS family arabinose efflux permease
MTLSGSERGLGILGVATLAMAPAIALGMGRFAYALVLPAMATGLGWTWAEAGWLNGANAAGYMLGALAAAPVMARLGGSTTVLFGVALAILGMVGCAATGDLAALSALRLVTGAGGALAFVAGGVLAASVAQGTRGGLLLGLFYAGPGFGIAVSGVAMPAWFAQGGGWPGAWLLLAALSLAMAVPLALSLLGRGARGGGASGVSGSAPLLAMAPILLAYAMFGFGYIGYMTFVFAWVRDAWGAGTGQAGFWVLIGAGGMAAPWLWAGLLERAAPARAFSVLTALCGVGAALPLAGDAAGWIIASAALFGACFFAVVASTTQFVRRHLDRAAWPSGVAAMTIAFSLGQTVGPVLAGALADAAGGLGAALALSAVGLGVASLMALAQPRVARG